jgi:hypothetical protein
MAAQSPDARAAALAGATPANTRVSHQTCFGDLEAREKLLMAGTRDITVRSEPALHRPVVQLPITDTETFREVIRGYAHHLSFRWPCVKLRSTPMKWCLASTHSTSTQPPRGRGQVDACCGRVVEGEQLHDVEG